MTPSASRRASWLGGAEARVQELGQRFEVRDRVQREVEPLRVADDDGAVGILLGGGRVEAEVIRVEPQAALVVAHRQPEVAQLHGR